MSRKKTTSKDKQRDALPRRHVIVASAMAGLVAGMVGLSYAAVPLYQMFCQVTGYGGTTQRAESAPDTILQRKMTVRFDANSARDMGWKFQPAQRSIELRIGETALAFYRAENITKNRITGSATFNVTPEAAGSYFSKIECFCFTEQTLEAGASADMPVTFFIDPEIVNDPEARNIKEITLSYTFFPVKDAEEVAKVRGTNSKANGS